MMMFNMFIHDLEVNIKSVLIRFGMTRISGKVGTLTRGSCGELMMPCTSSLPTQLPRGAEGS